MCNEIILTAQDLAKSILWKTIKMKMVCSIHGLLNTVILSEI